VPEKQADGEQMAIRLEYRFDRLLAEAVARHELVVPERRDRRITRPSVARRF
jgi:hypothetical protein